MDTAGCCSLATASVPQQKTEKKISKKEDKEERAESEAKERKDIEYPETYSLKNSSNITEISRRSTDISALNLSLSLNRRNIPPNYSNGENLEIFSKGDSNGDNISKFPSDSNGNKGNNDILISICDSPINDSNLKGDNSNVDLEFSDSNGNNKTDLRYDSNGIKRITEIHVTM